MRASNNVSLLILTSLNEGKTCSAEADSYVSAVLLAATRRLLSVLQRREQMEPSYVKDQEK